MTKTARPRRRLARILLLVLLSIALLLAGFIVYLGTPRGQPYCRQTRNPLHPQAWQLAQYG